MGHSLKAMKEILGVTTKEKRPLSLWAWLGFMTLVTNCSPPIPGNAVMLCL